MLRSMRDRLVSVSEEVAQALTKANWHAETAPSHVRGRVQAGITDIAHTQDWLQTRLSQLPTDPQQRYAAMQDMLQMQFVAVQKVSSILDELLTMRNKPVSPDYLPPEMRPPPDPRFQVQPLPSFGTLQAGAPIARDFGPALAAPITAPLFGAQPALPHFGNDPQLLLPGPAMEPLEPSWGPLPQAFAPAAQRGGAVHLTSLDVPSGQPMPAGQVPRALAGRKADRPSRKGGSGKRPGLVTGALLLAIAVVGIGGYVAWSQMSGSARPQRVAIGDPAARKATGPGSATAPVRPLDPVASRVPQAPPMSAPPLADDAGPAGVPGENFVAVIATHREKDGLTNMFIELRKAYPEIVAARKATAQTVNLGTDGVWYQLVLLPPGTRQQAQGVCDELRRAGYPRCAIRPNKP